MSRFQRLISVVTMVFIIGQHQTEGFATEIRRDAFQNDLEFISVIEKIAVGDLEILQSLSPEKKLLAFQLLSDHIADQDLLVALSDVVIGFEYRDPEEMPEIDGQYYPTQWRFPFCGSWKITCGYDCWVGGRNTHSGSDDFALDWSVSNAAGQFVIAPADGWVVWSGYAGDYGVVTILNHGNNVFSRLAHLNDDAWLIRQPRYIHQGDIVGTCGTTGYTTGPHIHFAVLENARWGGGATIIGNPIRQNGISGQWDLQVGSFYDSFQGCQCR